MHEFHFIEILCVPERGNENYREFSFCRGHWDDLFWGDTCNGDIFFFKTWAVEESTWPDQPSGAHADCNWWKWRVLLITWICDEQGIPSCSKWTVIEGVGVLFVVLGVGGISTGTGFLVWLVTRTFPRYTEPDSAQYAILCLVRKGSEWSKF